MKKREIYLDYAATSYVDERVLKKMIPFFCKIYANPSSLHSPGIEANSFLKNSRELVAKIINSKPHEIIFTSGGTESINLALKGVSYFFGKGHIITSKIEHSAVLETCKFLEKNNFSVTYLNVDRYGLISPEDVEKAIRSDTILITVMYANNEIGTIQPIQEIGKIARKHRVLFHTDACQAAGSLTLDVKKLNVDLMTLNGSKIYGPKGSGILYKKEDVKISPLLHGGGQEFNLRSGTENLPAIVGFSLALEIAQKERESENKRLIALRDYLIKNLLKKIPKSILNGHPTKRLPNNANISFLDVEGESILLHLNEKGVFVSTGSACTSRNLEVSHVLDAIGLSHDFAHGSIRFTLGRKTTKKDIDYVIKVLPQIIRNLRKISPINLELKSENEVKN